MPKTNGQFKRKVWFSDILFDNNELMPKKKMYAESDLVALAKMFREKSGKSKAQMARELGVTRATMQDAEEHPHRSMTKLRCRIIEACSSFQVAGPGYWLEKRTKCKR